MPWSCRSFAAFVACALTACSGSPEPLRPPQAPTGLTGTPFDSAVVLSWDASADAASYNVYRSPSPGLQPSAMAAIATGLAGTTFTAPAANDLVQYYRVTATSAAGESAASTEVAATPLSTLPPATPTGVKAVASVQAVTLTWDFVPGATGYRVFWAVEQDPAPGAPSFTCDASPCTHTPLASGVSHRYVVAALIGANESAPSAPVGAVPLSLPYISAMARTRPGSGNHYIVAVCADTACRLPVMNATVTISGTVLAFNASDVAYKAEPGGSITGALLELTVSLPGGWGTPSGTYTASGTMYATAPVLTNPTEGGIWQASQENTLTWTAASPGTDSVYKYVLVDLGCWGCDFWGTVPSPSTSIPITAGSLLPGARMGYVAVSRATPIAIPETAVGSGFQIEALSPLVPFTVE